MKKVMSYSMVIGIIAVAIIVGFALTAIYPLPKPLPRPGQTQVQPPPVGDNPRYYTVKTVLSFLNMALCLFLLYIYINIYRQVKSNFTLGLIIVMLAMFIYALTSNSLLQVMFGFRAEGLGPFAMIPSLFASVALIVLSFLSIE